MRDDRVGRLMPRTSSAIGDQVSMYGVGVPLKPIYGSDTVELSVFVRFRPSANTR